MKTIIISLATLAAISTTALAGENRNNELRDSEYYITTGYKAAQSDTAALAIESGKQANSAYARTLWLQELNDMGRH